jgi:hypothetical protein
MTMWVISVLFNLASSSAFSSNAIVSVKRLSLKLVLLISKSRTVLKSSNTPSSAFKILAPKEYKWKFHCGTVNGTERMIAKIIYQYFAIFFDCIITSCILIVFRL